MAIRAPDGANNNNNDNNNNIINSKLNTEKPFTQKSLRKEKFAS